MRASDGGVVWTFSGQAEPGRDGHGRQRRDDRRRQQLGRLPARGGGAPWTHGAIDPELNLVFYTFNNARGCSGSQDSSGRQGQNLFANTLVAIDAKTGAYKWHFQAVHQDVWDMDNTHPPLLANLTYNGQPRKAIYYGSKSAHLFVLDRATGKPILKAEETPVSQDSRQKSYPTQPLPNRPLPTCLVWQALDPKNVPGDPWRAVPNYNGYQPDAKGQLVYQESNYLDPDKPFVEYPAGMTHREGCLYDTHFDLPVLSTTSQNGGPTFAMYSLSHKLGLIFYPYAVNPVAHWRGASEQRRAAHRAVSVGRHPRHRRRHEHRALDEPAADRHGPQPEPALDGERPRVRRDVRWLLPRAGRDLRQGTVALPDRGLRPRRRHHL